MPNDFSINKRIEVKIHRIISEAISLKIKDKRLKTIIITEVNLSRDLGYAKIYFTSLNQDNQNKNNIDILNKASGFLRKEISNKLSIKKVPELTFIFDTKEEEANHINKLIDSAIENDKK
ncbi:MAG: 30S ribosome-binding factor RbfA [Gammaproteobacteria bacterium]|nr:30S ribosome-binding factor RbfA [Gammaproteobacteria bacterium]